MRLLRLSPLLLAAALLPIAGVAGAETKLNTDKLGSKIANVAFKDVNGKTVNLHDLKGKKAVVVLFLNFECPNCTSYSQLLAELNDTYGPKGVAFLGVCAVEEETLASLVKHAKDYKIPFPIYKDQGNAAVEALKATTTPEAFLLDHNFFLRYRGRIDDGFAARLKRNVHITNHDLKNALDEQLAGKAITTPATLAIGCPLFSERTVKKDGAVTYHRDVAPILQNHCQGCHRPGEVGPFSLMTYKQAVNWASDIKDYTQSRQMPPWRPVEGKAFHNDRRMNDKDIATLAAWADGGTPEGNPKDAPAPKQFPEGWHLGKPDLVLTMSDDFTVGPSGRDHFRCFVLPTGLTEDKYVTAVEVRPGNPRVVHHTLLFIDTQGQGKALEQKEKERVKKEDEQDHGPGYSVGMGGVGFTPRGGLSGWAPGQLPRHKPEGTGYFLPKNSDIIMQMHYHRDGRVEKDRSQIGLYFAKKPVEKQFQGLVIAGGGVLGLGLLVPPGAENHKVSGTTWVQSDCVVYEIMPHMHMIGKKIKVTMTPPDGEKQTLLGIDQWDYNWQETYLFKEPLQVKAGTRFDVEAIYDNSMKNPNNPSNPPKLVRFGEQTTNEMCFIFMGGTSDEPGRRIRMSFTPPAEKK